MRTDPKTARSVWRDPHCRRTLAVRIAILLVLALGGCVHIPRGLTAVQGFQVQRYLGTWYEVARLDHWFERGLSNVTATYSLNDYGRIRVQNRGYDETSGRWKNAEGRAELVSGPEVGRLRVSFFGPFYGGYNVVALDEDNYEYALVCGNNRSYLWILSRTPQLPDTVMAELLEKARALGFKTEGLIFVQHTTTPLP